MTKRLCPFEDNCMPQLKVHVKTEDIERRDEMYMKSVYDKTMTKLYQGVNYNVRHIINDKENSCNLQLSLQRLCIECKEIKYIRGNCWFCEVSLCSSCIKNCSMCSEQFCSRCSVAIFKNGNNFSCLTCYS